MSISTDATKDGAEPTFEATLERLREVVARLEDGAEPLALEESLALFEEGVRLSKAATTSLEAAERRVEVLLSSGEVERADGPGGQ
jgi:exodeoxyribonuclease VII small subunit